MNATQEARILKLAVDYATSDVNAEEIVTAADALIKAVDEIAQETAREKVATAFSGERVPVKITTEGIYQGKTGRAVLASVREFVVFLDEPLKHDNAFLVSRDAGFVTSSVRALASDLEVL